MVDFGDAVADDGSARAWVAALEAVKEAGVGSDLDVRATATSLRGSPTPDAICALLRAYHRDPDPVERAWRAQRERWLELPAELLSPEIAAEMFAPLVPEERLAIRRSGGALEVRLGSSSVLLRRVARHRRSGVVRTGSLEEIDPPSLVYALNVLLDMRGHPMRFVPLRATARSAVWVGATEDRALQLAALDLLASSDPRQWRAFARFRRPTLRLAS